MNKLYLIGSAVFLLIALTLVMFNEHLLALGLAVVSMMLLLPPTASHVDKGGKLALKKRTKKNISEIREYRENHPKLSLIESVREVEGRV